MFSGILKPSKLRAIGIDLGTTNSAAAQSLSPAARRTAWFRTDRTIHNYFFDRI
jgi:molecular chaperone DnaK (HSP70)